MDAMSAADDWVERASERLAAAGYRRGGARRAVIRLLGEQHCALSAVEIGAALEREDRAVSRASVYRILEELEQAELVTRIEVGQGVVRYEPLRHGRGHHHHMVCDRCGRLDPFVDEGLERELRRVSEHVALQVAEHEVILHGACERCAAEAPA
jgi:Fur family transcriptional regulator, ferric uptake regulator